MEENQEEWSNSVTTTIANITGLVFEGWMILEASEVRSGYKASDDETSYTSNLGFRTPGFGSLLVAVPTTEDPPEPPREIDGIKVVPLEEYIYGITQIGKANERTGKLI